VREEEKQELRPACSLCHLEAVKLALVPQESSSPSYAKEETSRRKMQQKAK